MKKISGYVDPEKWSKRLGLPYYKQEWFLYDFGTGWKNRHGKTSKNATKKVGHIWNFEAKRLNNQRLKQMLEGIINDEWENAATLYGGLIAFCLKYCKDDITYYEDNRPSDDLSVSRCCEELKFPNWCRCNLEKIFTLTPSLKNYLHAFDNAPQVNFDIDAALMVYKMQGEKAIFSILMQLFFRYRYIDVTTVNLVPDLPIIWLPKASNLVSGTGFPVVVTKFSNNFRWEKNDDGVFLVDEFDNALDCVAIGNFNVFKEFLGNRLTFVWRSGFRTDYLICWSWGDLINAVGHYNGDILVRNLGGGFENWFKFGINGKIAVWTEDGRVYAKKGSGQIPELKVMSYPGEGKWVSMLNLLGERVDDEIGEEVVWTKEEIYDWFELGKLCQQVLE